MSAHEECHSESTEGWQEGPASVVCAVTGVGHAFFTASHVLFATKFKHGQAGDRRWQGRRAQLGNREKPEGRGEGRHMVEGTAHLMAAWKREDRKGPETRQPSNDLPPTRPQLRLSAISP